MRYLRNFIIAMLIIFISIALGNAALAKHTPDTAGFWLVTIDYDASGNPSLSRNPAPRVYRTGEQCEDVGVRLLSLLQQYQPGRRFVMLCIMPDDEENIIAAVTRLGNEFRGFFIKPGKAA